MDRILKEERKYIAGLVSKIVKSGANVVLVQKSILRDATSDLSLHFLAKKGIMVVKDIEREDIEFIAKTIEAIPVAHIDNLREEKLGNAKLVEETRLSDESTVLKMTGVPNTETMTIFIRGTSNLILDEVDRSLHDALCVVRAIVKERGLIPGGGAVEIYLSQKLMQHALTLGDVDSLVFRAYAEALEVIPYTLVENAGLNPLEIVTDLKNRQRLGNKYAAISIKRNAISDDITKEGVVQPLLVTTS